MKKKVIALVMAAVLLVTATAAATVAYLTDSDEVLNTFTIGKVDIELEETKDDFQMIPGEEIEKDPIVTVVDSSEDCWLFVELTESANLDDYISYTVAEGWTALEGVDGVYYRKVLKDDAEKTFSVLEGDKVVVLEEVTNEMMDAASKDAPTLKVTAYAIQLAGFEEDAAGAWAALNA